MSSPGLAYDQAPPLGVPLGFFLLAPAFLLLTALAGMATAAEWTASRWSPAALALTHLLTLGFLAMVMLGALLQMLPVLLGMPVPAARWVATAGRAGLALGSPLLALGLWQGEPALLQGAMAVLALGLAPFLAGMAAALTGARSLAREAWPMRQAWLGLLLALGLGLALAGGLAGLWPLADTAALAGQHVAWGLGGWVLLLVIGVAYQVVPMLQITPSYPAWLTRWLTWLLLAGLLGYGLAASRAPDHARAGLAPALAAALVFALATLHLQQRRRRRLADATLDFWRLGMVALILSTLMLPLLPWLPEAAETTLGLAFLLGFAASVVNGMLYKIVPFLAWFHLQAQTGARAGSIPNMREMISDQAAHGHYRLHLAAVLLLLPTPFLPPWATMPGLLLLAATALLLGRNLLAARRLFLAHGGRL